MSSQDNIIWQKISNGCNFIIVSRWAKPLLLPKMPFILLQLIGIKPKFLSKSGLGKQIYLFHERILPKSTYGMLSKGVMLKFIPSIGQFVCIQSLKASCQHPHRTVLSTCSPKWPSSLCSFSANFNSSFLLSSKNCFLCPSTAAAAFCSSSSWALFCTSSCCATEILNIFNRWVARKKQQIEPSGLLQITLHPKIKIW